jgi:outer membrane receptor protein involved in Fe transport
MKIKVAIFVVVSLLCLGRNSYAQTTNASVTGRVTDPNSGGIPGATITLTNTDTNLTFQANTDESGNYYLTNVPVGNYRLESEKPGFRTVIKSGIVLHVNDAVAINVELVLGSVAESITVEADAVQVQLVSSSIGEVVNSTTVRELPLNGRDWTQLATLQPGVLGLRTQLTTSGSVNRGVRGFGNQMSVSGHRPYENNYRINGISVNDYSNGAPGSVDGAQLGVDGVQEFSVLTSNYSAEYGRTSGGVINAITKSGTNAIHGDLFYFMRDEGLDARNFFDPAKIPPFHRNQFGGSLGGPVLKDKTFFFLTYEGLTEDKSLSYLDTVPSAAARAGNMCSVPYKAACTPNTITVSPLVTPYLGFWPFPNAGLIASGNGDTGSFKASALSQTTENYASARVDHTISDKDSLVASWLYDKSPNLQPDKLLGTVSEVLSWRSMASLEESHVFSQNIVNAARFGFSRVHALVEDPSKALNPLSSDPSLGVVPGGFAPDITVTGLATEQSAFGGPSNYHETQNSFQFYDDLSIIRSNHSIKMGFAVERIQYDDQLIQRNGNFYFSSLTNFLTNKPRLFTGNGPLSSPTDSRQTLFGAYIQDDWRVRPNLTVNLGLRYEPTTLPTEANNGFQVMTNLYTSVPTPVTTLWQKNQTLKNFAPRVGFSWDPFKTGKTAVRGGFGIFDVLPLPWLYTHQDGAVYPFDEQLSALNLNQGDFPYIAVTKATAVSSNIASRYVEQDPKRNYSMDWNLNIQRQITPSLSAMVGFVGSRTVHQPFTADDENMVLPTLTSAGWLWPYPVGTGTKLNPNVGEIRMTQWDGDAFYDGLQVQLTKQMSHGVQLQGSYTWSKCIDTGSAGHIADPYTNSMNPIPYFIPQARRGLCDFDIRNNLVVNYIWNVPTPKLAANGPLSYVARGWQLSGIITASNGTPFSVLIAGDPLGMNAVVPIALPDRLNTPGCANPINPGNPNNYLKLNCFTPPIAPASYAGVCKPAAASVAALIPNTCMNLFGNSGRNELIGPGIVNVDFSIFKNNYLPKLSDTFNVQFRTEVFNILNRADFQSPLDHNTVLNTDGTPANGAGQIDATSVPSREIQFGLKVIW